MATAPPRRRFGSTRSTTIANSKKPVSVAMAAIWLRSASDCAHV